jgi:hypothetical protein
MESSIDDLSFVKLKIPRLIPIELIEAVKGRTFSPEQFYKYMEAQKDSPFVHLYVLTDAGKVIHGYLWAEINLLDGSLFVNTFSIKKEYWGKGTAVSKVIEFLKELKKKTKATQVFWVTTNEKFFVKHGFKKSRNVLMSYEEEVL